MCIRDRLCSDVGIGSSTGTGQTRDTRTAAEGTLRQLGHLGLRLRLLCRSRSLRACGCSAGRTGQTLQSLKPLQTRKQWRGARLSCVRDARHSTTRHPGHRHAASTAATTSAAAFGHQVSRARLCPGDNPSALLIVMMPLKPIRELRRMGRRTGLTGRTGRTRRTTSRHALALKLCRRIGLSLSRSRIHTQRRLTLLL